MLKPLRRAAGAIAGVAVASSGQRARAGESRGSVTPRAKRRAPTQAIIAALSEQSEQRRGVERVVALRAELLRARAQAQVGGDTAGDDEVAMISRLRLAQSWSLEDRHRAHDAVGHAIGDGGFEGRRKGLRRPCRRSGVRR